MILIQAFMSAARLPFPPPESYWASNFVYGFGKGTSSMLYGVARGIGGIVYDPYIGAKQRGLKGGSIGVVKGLGGIVARPIKGCFDFVAQPIAGIINTPHFIYKRLKIKKDPTDKKETNFTIFGIDSEYKRNGKRVQNPVE